MEEIKKSFQDDPVIQKNRWLIFFTIGMFTFMSTLDGSIVNVALPVISTNLGHPIAQIEWIVTSYLMTICSLLLFFGRMGDAVGKIKVFRIGALLFIIGSFLCGFSHNLTMLVCSRIIQAAGASMTMAVNMGIVTDIFPITERGRALGMTGMLVSLGSITGPGLGGLIVKSLGWQYIFWVNVPIGLVLAFLGLKILPKDLFTKKVVFDIAGIFLFIVFIVSFFSGILLSQQFGFSDIRIIAALVVAAISIIAFVLVETKKEQPMLQLSILKNAMFLLSSLTGFLVFIVLFCFNIIFPFYTQSILALPPDQSGLLLMVFPLAMAVTAPLSGALSDKIGSEWLTFIGLLLLTAIQVAFSTLNQSSPIAFICVMILFAGIANGIFQSPNNSMAMSSVPRQFLGIAGSISALSRNMGMVVGISVATTTLFAMMSKKAGYRVTGMIPDKPEIFLHGMHGIFHLTAFICLVALCLTGYRLYKNKFTQA